MSILLFIFYYLLCIVFIYKMNFYKNINISFLEKTILFSIKVGAGFLYAYYFLQPSLIQTSDTWNFFNESLVETQKLLHQPKLFFSEFWFNQYNNNGGFFTGVNSFWNDLKTTVFVKFLAVLNLFSGNNYFINLLFFNLIVFSACIALYKLINQIFKVNKYLLIITTFLLPGFLFWSSGLHKDGIAFSAIVFAFYFFYKLLFNRFNKKYFLGFCCSFFVLFLLRNYVLLAIIPVLFAWWLTVKFYKFKYIIFVGTILSCLTTFFFSSKIHFTNSISNSVVQKHNEFQQLTGNTKILTPVLENNSRSIIHYFPFSLKTAFFYPIPNTSISKAVLINSLENYLYLLIAIIGIYYGFKRKNIHPLLLSFIGFSFLMYIFIGYTVCFSAAIVRYRDIILPFFVLPFVLTIFGRIKSKAEAE